MLKVAGLIDYQEAAVQRDNPEGHRLLPYLPLTGARASEHTAPLMPPSRLSMVAEITISGRGTFSVLVT